MTNYVLIIPFFLVAYLAVSPLIKDPSGEIHFDSAIVALTIGLVISGFLLQISLILNLDKRVTIFLPLLLISTVNCFLHRHNIKPTIPRLKVFHLIGYGFLFFLYSGATLIASLKSGYGDYPQVFFNVDTPYRLTLAHELLNGKEFPTESLGNLGYFASPMHMGGPAIAASISVITGLPINTAYFSFGMPLLCLGTFCCFTVFSRNLGLSAERQVLSVLLLSSTVYFGDLVWKLVSTPMGSTISQIVGPLSDITVSDPIRLIGFGVYSNLDITYQTGFFLLGCLLIFSVLEGKQKIFGYGLIVILAGTSKIDLVPLIVLIAIAQIFLFQKIDRVLLYCVLVSTALISIVVLIFATTYDLFNRYSFQLSIDPKRLFDYETRLGQHTLLDLRLLLCGVLIYVYVCKENLREANFSLLLPGVIALAVQFIFYNILKVEIFVDNESITHHLAPGSFLLIANWIVLPFCISALLAHSSFSRRTYRWPSRIYFLPFIVAVLFVSIMKLENNIKYMYYPSTVSDYVNNKSIGELLRKVPKGNTLLVTNDFRYPASNFDRDLMQVALPALFGHQWYAVDVIHFWGNRDIKRRLDFQRQILAGDEPRILDTARENGWTHYLERIEKAPIKKKLLFLLDENRDYRLYQLLE